MMSVVVLVDEDMSDFNHGFLEIGIFLLEMGMSPGAAGISRASFWDGMLDSKFLGCENRSLSKLTISGGS